MGFRPAAFTAPPGGVRELWDLMAGQRLRYAGALVATYIMVEAPLSGMSMNPARTLASAAPAGVWDAVWIYFIAPPLGMLLAGLLRPNVGTVGSTGKVGKVRIVAIVAISPTVGEQW